jgi:hypothetical protein
MSTIVSILKETEVTLPVSLVQALEKALRRERQERQLREPLGRREPPTPGNRRLDPSLAVRVHPPGAHRPDARPPNARPPEEGRPGSARDMDMARPVAVGIGRAHPTGRSIQRSAKSQIVPEPDQIKSKRPEPRPFAGRFEPRG